MGSEGWDSGKIETMIANYESRGHVEGGIHTLAQLRVERRRRTKSQIDTIALSSAIIAKSAAAPDGLTTYKELWNEFRPGEVVR